MRWACGARLLTITAATIAAASCSPRGDPRPISSQPSPPERPKDRIVTPILTPPRYVVPDGASWVEQTSDGIDRVLINGARVESRGITIERVSEAEPEVAAGIPVPAWASPPSGAAGARYLFWNNKDLYGAPSFMGELTKITTTTADIARAFDWLDGVGLLTAGGALLVRGSSVEPFPLPGVVAAVASDAERGVALTTFGRAWLTTTGAAGLRDVSASVGEAARVEVRGDEIAILNPGERARFVGESGAIVDSSKKPGRRRGARPPVIDEKWPASAGFDPIDAAVLSGVPLADGSILVAVPGHVARIDPTSGRAISSAEVPDPTAVCSPLKLPDALLLVCQGKERASVIDVTGAPRVERTFDIVDAADYDRFVGVDGEALGFVGPCAGGGPKPSDLDIVTAASPYNTSNQRSPAFCVRVSRDAWIERRVDPADQADVIAWIPRARGAAVAVVARPGMFIKDAERTSERGDLRVVRVARSEPPLAIPQYSGRASVPLARFAHVLPDGSVEGWLPTSAYPSNSVGATIDPQGRVRVRPAPSRTSTLSSFGPFAMAQTEDGKLYETVDWGETWIPVDPPPGRPLSNLSNCSAAGCRVGPFVRLGWASGDPAVKRRAASVLAMDDDVMTPAVQKAIRERAYRRSPPAPPIVRLRCSFTSQGEGARLPDSYGFGVTPSPVARSSGPSKLAWIGSMILPWSGPQAVMTGDASVAWVPLLDVAAPIRRADVPLASLNLDLRYRPYDVRLGYVIDQGGRVSPIAAGTKDSCVAAILERAGVVRPIGGCAGESTLGVDLGSKIVLHSGRYGSQTISVVDIPEGRGKAPSGGPIVIAQRELYKTPVAAGSYGYGFAVGSRAGAPVVVAVDGAGRALLSPIDAARGALGPEERLASLADVILGDDPKCAASPDDARVIYTFDSEIGVDRARMPGVYAAGTYGLAVVRFSKQRACLDAVELSVRDERYELDLGYYETPGTLRKLIARFSPGPATAAGQGNAALALVMYGAELRQRVQCDGIGP